MNDKERDSAAAKMANLIQQMYLALLIITVLERLTRWGTAWDRLKSRARDSIEAGRAEYRRRVNPMPLHVNPKPWSQHSPMPRAVQTDWTPIPTNELRSLHVVVRGEDGSKIHESDTDIRPGVEPAAVLARVLKYGPV